MKYRSATAHPTRVRPEPSTRRSVSENRSRQSLLSGRVTTRAKMCKGYAKSLAFRNADFPRTEQAGSSVWASGVSDVTDGDVRRHPGASRDRRRDCAVGEPLGGPHHPVDVEQQRRLGHAAQESSEHRPGHELRRAAAERSKKVPAQTDVPKLVAGDLVEELTHALARLGLIGEDRVEDLVEVQIDGEAHQLGH